MMNTWQGWVVGGIATVIGAGLLLLIVVALASDWWGE